MDSHVCNQADYSSADYISVYYIDSADQNQKDQHVIQKVPRRDDTKVTLIYNLKADRQQTQ